MNTIFQVLHEQLLQKRPCMLLSVVRSHGSAPRGAGAHMLVDENRILTGTIGGGNLEHQAFLLAKDWLCTYLRTHTEHADEIPMVSMVSPSTETEEPVSGFLRHFVLNTDEAKHLGMVCGGNVDVLFTPFLPNSACHEFVTQAVSYLTNRTLFWLALPLNGTAPALLTNPSLWELSSELPYNTHSYQGSEYYIEKMLDTSRVFLFGGGHISRELVPLLSHLKFRCIVSDDRPEFVLPEQFPDAEETRIISFLDLESYFTIKPEDYIVVLTRGHEWDTDVQRFALKTDARYIGVVGSRRKKAAVFQKLMEDGFTEEDLKRIVTPIGLSIGAQTPAEIAVSIAAQMIAVRSGHTT